VQELIISHVAVTLLNEEYTGKEKSLIKELTKAGAAVDVVIPDTIEAADFEIALGAVCKVISRAEMQKEGLIPVLGRLLFVASEHLEALGYETFDSLVASISMRFGVGRSTCFEAKGYWKRWSEVLAPEDYRAVGRVKLKMLSQAVDAGKEGQKRASAAVEFAKAHTANELEEYLDKEFHVTPGSATGAVLKIASSKAANKRIIKWFEDERVHAYCGTDDLADILEAMIGECQGEWQIAGQQKLDEMAASAETLNEDQAQGAEA
jgi:hypothetical protein